MSCLRHTVALLEGVTKSNKSSSEWSSVSSRRSEVALGDPKFGIMAARIRAKQSATCVLGAQARAGLCPSSSSASKFAPLVMSSCTTGTKPFLADTCKGLWEHDKNNCFVDEFQILDTVPAKLKERRKEVAKFTSKLWKQCSTDKNW